MFLDTIIKNLCCAAITGATNNLLTGSAGDRNQSLIAFSQSVDALVHFTPHPRYVDNDDDYDVKSTYQNVIIIIIIYCISMRRTFT
jgi:hypothetical protein